MNRLTNMKRAAAGGAVAVLLLTGGAVPALAASPSLTVAECTANKASGKSEARLAFKDAKIKAWAEYAGAIESADAKGTMKKAAQMRRDQVRAALKVRKEAFKQVRMDFRECMSTASDAPVDTSS